ncbi:MAG TPA: gamma-glutamyltransferase [Saprospiraceae bacterium]|nr:gamma-glutamyltransferase [Saprospiraceae bacterium]
MNRKFLAFLCIILLIFSCKDSNEYAQYNITKSAIGEEAMVVTAHPEATRIGIEILKKGGNAVDAAIAVQFALAVCYPVAGNIGGGGFMIYRDKDGNSFALDYREKAPLKASENMYLDKSGNPIKNLSTLGHLAAGVPGTVDGMVEAFHRFSKLKDWKALIQPSIDLALNGVVLTEREARNLNNSVEKFKAHNTIDHVFMHGGWLTGDIMIQTDLGHTLEEIRDKGRNGFYEGKTANFILGEMRRGHGIITMEDLKNYKSVWREPVTFKYRGYNFISMPPPSSGGIALAQLLKTIEPYNLGEMGFHTSQSVHLMIEAEKRAYADRATYLGDPDFFDIPIVGLIDSMYIANRFSDFDPKVATSVHLIQAGSPEQEQTTHYSIIDDEGNSVSMTTTLNGGYGAYTIVGHAGFLLNNEMDDFSSKPGHPNMYGLIGAAVNKIEPGKRMLSSMTPTIIEKDGKVVLIVGTPGGSTIITSVFQTIVNIIDYNMSAIEAVTAPRFHHQWVPEDVFVEELFPVSLRNSLSEMGHKVTERSAIGRVEAIRIRPDGKIEGAADPRGDDDAKGY